MKNRVQVTVSAPAKIHLLGEHAVVYGKPALLAAVDLRVKVTISPLSNVIASKAKQSSPEKRVNKIATLSLIARNDIRKVIEPIVKNYLKLKNLPPYSLEIASQIPIGSGLGSSAALSASYLAALLSYLKKDWDLELINRLAYQAEIVFHGNPSGADNSTVVHGGLMWFRREIPEVKILHPLPFTISKKLAKNFVIIQTGTPKESTKEMVGLVKDLYDKKPKAVENFLSKQESLSRQLLSAILQGDEASLIKIIQAGEANLESIGVCSPRVKKVIRQIEAMGGAAKICGGGGATDGTGVLLTYHPKPAKIKAIAKQLGLNFFSTSLGGTGLKQE